MPPVERLERRVLLTVWDGGAGTLNWNDAANWDNDTLPGPGDDVTIDISGSTETIVSSANVSINSLNSQENLSLTGGTFSVAGLADINAVVSINAATISGGTWDTSGGAMTFNNSTTNRLTGVTLLDELHLFAGGYVELYGGTTFTSARLTNHVNTSGTLAFEPGSTIPGDIVVDSTNSREMRVVVDGAGTLTIPAGVTIDVSPANGAADLFLGDSNDTVINQGTLRSTNGFTQIQASQFTNDGAVEANGALLQINPTPTNYTAGTLTGGNWIASGGGTLRAQGVDIETNAATIVLDGAGANFYNATTGTTSALANLAANNVAGSLTLQNGATLATAGPLENSGTVSVDSSSTLTVGGTGPLPNDAIAKWTGDGNANDVAGTNDGTIVGGITFDNGQSGQAFDFDGANTTRIEIPDTNDLRFANSFTFAGWVNTSSSGAFADILRKRHRDNGGLMDIGIGMSDANKARFYLVDDTGNFDAATGIHGTTDINDGEWHYIVGVRDDANSMMRLYVDGQEEASLATTTGTFLEVNSVPWNVGNNPGTTKSPWDGLIDEVEVFGRALSPAEILAVADAGHFNQTSGSLSLDGGTVAAAGAVNLFGGTLVGTGTLQTDRLFAGNATMAPGNSPGIITIDGDLTLDADSVTEIEIAGTNPATPDFDQIIVTGTATLDGTLNVTLINDFQPLPGDAFEIMQFGSRVGDFATVNGLDLGNGLTLQPTFDADSLTLITVGLSPFAVTNTNDSGTGSLRQALLNANAIVGADTVTFNIPGVGLHTIQPLSALPTIIETVIIDGWTQPDFAGTPVVEINGNGVTADGLFFTTGSNGSEVRGLVINRFDGNGIYVASDGVIITGNFIGTDAAGTGDLGNTGHGIRIVNAASTVIGGTTSADRNVISGNAQQGIDISGALATNNTILGNDIGVDATGNAGLGNDGHGIRIWIGSTGNTIGGAAAGAGNVISGNAFAGIALGELTDAGGNLVEGNIIGLNADGDTAIPNSTGAGSGGIAIASSNNTIRGNVISGNQAQGILFSSLNDLANDNLIVGNLIGTDATGLAAVGASGRGIFLQQGAHDNIIGGTTIPDRNVISGNSDGILVNSATVSGTVIQGNYVGLGADGSTVIGNLFQGVYVADSSATIGGDAPGAGNVISSNAGDGVRIEGVGNGLPDGIVSWWRAEGDATDFAGDNDGTALSGASFASGQFGQGFSFDGSTNTGISIPDDNDLRFAGNFSLQAWVKTTSAAAIADILRKRNRDNGGLMDVGIGMAGGHARFFAYDDAGNNDAPTGIQGTTVINDGQWHHIVGVRDAIAGTLSLYVDGTLETSVADTTSTYLEVNAAPWLIGNNAGTIKFPWDGQIDEVSIYDRAIGVDEVAALFTAGGATTSGSVVQGNIIGLDAAGTVDRGNAGDGIEISGSPLNLIGGSTAGARNVISGNAGDGVLVAGTGSVGNQVAGNYIGTNAAGTTAIANAYGVYVDTGAANNVVGTDGDGAGDAGEGNLLSGNTYTGVTIEDNASFNVVAGNLIGTNAAGTTALGNGHHGVHIRLGANNNRIGTNADGVSDEFERNIISGTQQFHGVSIVNPGTDDNVVAGNYIGTDVNGTTAIANESTGVLIQDGAKNNLIGGASPAARNVISGNGDFGVWILLAGTDGNAVQGNFIGTDATGMSALGNAIHGVAIGAGAQNNIIGTDGDGVDDDAERNVISANLVVGVNIDGAGTDSNVVAGNLIGTDVTGTTALGNVNNGLIVSGGAKSNRIGTNSDGVSDGFERNVISGTETFHGVALRDAGTEGNVVAGNYIGTDIDGTFAIANAASGIAVSNGAANNLIGGATDADRNVISGNDGIGVWILDAGTDGNVVQGNYIGTDAFGTLGLANNNGVNIGIGAQNNVIGTDGDGVDDANEGNVISANSVVGVNITGAGTDFNVVAGNLIGTDAAGTAALGNTLQGVAIQSGAKKNRIGTNADGVSDVEERNVISGNLSFQEVSIIHAGTEQNVVAGNYIGPDISGAVALPNAATGVVIAQGAANNLIGGSDPAARNVISGNAFDGVRIINSGTDGNRVQGNYIGADKTGTIALGNLQQGVNIYDTATGNIIGTDGDGFDDAGEGNLISANQYNGVNIAGAGTDFNVVAGNLVGTDETGTSALGNVFSGVRIQNGAADNRVGTNNDAVSDDAERNLLSGNQSEGVILLHSGTENNLVAGNYIGTDLSGTGFLGNATSGVAIILGAANNLIGGTDLATRNVISGNTVDGVRIVNAGTDGNRVQGNYIGTDKTGTVALGNLQQGVNIFDSASGNFIGTDGDGVGDAGEANVISANQFYGVNIAGTGTEFNIVAGNFLGTDSAGAAALGNALSGARIATGASQNRIGTDADGVADANERNVIAGNMLHGVEIANSGTDKNVVAGNYIGTDVTGLLALGNAIDGVRIWQGAQSNRVGTDGSNDGFNAAERNVISGNGAFGVQFVNPGTSNNVVAGNYIGIDELGTNGLGNGADGVRIIAGAMANIIGTDGDGVGDAEEGNVISANLLTGVWIANPGTDSNIVAGNLIGTDAGGTVGLGNVNNGVVIQAGAQNNRVGTNVDGVSDDLERNVISASQAFQGVAIAHAGSEGNVVAGNYIGTDITGTAALGNATNGVIIFLGAANNVVGGADPAARNVISGNEGDGIRIVNAGTDGNRVQGNYIGTDKTGVTALPNLTHGINIFDTASANIIGTDGDGIGDADEGNVISGNQANGVIISQSGTEFNVVAGNMIGTDVTGNSAVGNATSGVVIGGGAKNNRIGTDGDGVSDDLERNVVSGNLGAGFLITDPGTDANIVAGNLIGTNAAGTAALGNAAAGVQIRLGAKQNRVGTDGDGVSDVVERNVIAANQVGVDLRSVGTNSNVLAGNYIGTDITGSTSLGTQLRGVDIYFGPQFNVIGTNGDGQGDGVEGNLISGNQFRGVDIVQSDQNIVAGNIIGPDATGTAAIDFGGTGVQIYESSGNRIGTNADGVSDAFERNIISGLSGQGVWIQISSTQNTVAGNYIGTDITGTTALGNDFNGILLQSGSTDNLIGGSSEVARNLISGNAIDGIRIVDADTDGNRVQGNYIGTDKTGTEPLGNLGHGVNIFFTASGNLIGTDADGLEDANEGNLISGNLKYGVDIAHDGSEFNIVAGNTIGTNSTSTAAIGNGFGGIQIGFGAKNNWVGGSNLTARNIVSGNAGDGIHIVSAGTFGNVVVGNYVGLNAAGTAALGNHDNGILIDDSAAGNRIGTDGDGVNDLAERNVISGNMARGVLISDSGTSDNTIAGNLIGTDVTGNVDLGNADDGIRIQDGPANNTIGGTTGGAGNVISGNNEHGVRIDDSDGNTVAGNIIGLNAAGTSDLGNTEDGVGINAGSSNNTVGGSVPGARNVISGNDAAGVIFRNDGTTNNLVIGNFIGTDITGSIALGNGEAAVTMINGPTQNRIGGSSPAERNILSGNTNAGVRINSANTANNVIQGNYIGLDVNGAPLGNNNRGVYLFGGSHDNTIGGGAPGEGNVISANAGAGIEIDDSDGNVLQGNIIGLNATGSLIFGNDTHGVLIINGSTDVTIGGTSAGERNVISGNAEDGIRIGDGVSSATDVTIIGNYIGTDVSGTLGRGNIGIGIQLIDGDNVQIGGGAAGAGNVISANAQSGIAILADSFGTIVQGNLIGTDRTGTAALGNGAGIVVHQAALIGTDEDGVQDATERNIIANNAGDGVTIIDGSLAGAVRIRQNTIRFNGDLGIDFGDDGVTPNGSGLQDHPLIATAVGGASTRVVGVVTGPANSMVLIDFYAFPSADAASFSKGQRFLATQAVSTNAAGNAAFDITLLGVATIREEFITATATPVGGSTSEFSPLEETTFAQPPTITEENLIVTALDESEDGQVAAFGLVTQIVPENTDFRLDGLFESPDPDDTHTVTVDWADGSSDSVFVEAGIRGFSFEHRYDDDTLTGTPADIFTVFVIVTESDGASGSASIPITVENVAPEIDGDLVLAPTAINEGEPVDLSGALVDPGLLDTHTVTVDWADGSPASTLFLAAGVTEFRFSHIYRDDNDPEATLITVTLKDDDTGQTVVQTSLDVANVPPVATILGEGIPIFEGDTVSLTAAVTDPGAGDTHTYQWTATVAGDVAATGTSQLFEFVPPDSGDYTISLIVTDDDGGVSEMEILNLPVLNVAPTIEPGDLSFRDEDDNPVAGVAEGSPIRMNGTFIDPGIEPHTVVIDWGDDGPTDTLMLEAGVTLFSITHVYADDPAGSIVDDFLVSVTVTDADLDLDDAEIAVTIGNLDPDPRIVDNGSDATTVRLAAVVDDAGTDTFIYAWTVLGATLPAGTPTDEPTISFPRPDDGVATVSLVVTDDDGGSTQTQILFVGGTDEADTITIAPTADTGDDPQALTVTVTSGGNPTDSNDVAPVDAILITTGAQNDVIVIDAAVTAPANVLAGTGNDAISSGSGDDLLEGGPGDDTVFAGAGNDTITSVGNDDLAGGTGNDNYVILGFSDKILREAGGDGTDTIDFAAVDQGVTLDLSSTDTAQEATAAGDTITLTGDFENLIGSDFDDTFLGNDRDNLLFSGEGNDTITGGGLGDDSLFGGGGEDMLAAAEGNDLIDGGDGNDTINAASGTDTTFFAGDDTIFGGEGNDLIFDAGGNDSFAGGGGDDSIVGGAGNDVFDGGMGNDTISTADGTDTTFFDGDDTIFGGDGNDLIFDGAGNDSFAGGGGDDSIIGGSGNDVFDGGAGNDTIGSAGGNDTTFVDGDDTIFGGEGNDLIFDGIGNDSFVGGGGDDSIIGGAGNDVFDGGAGNDTISTADGNDTTFFDGDDTIFGGEGNDLIFDGAGNDSFAGGGGDDSIIGGSGNDVFDGGMGNDTITSGTGNDTTFFDGDDTIFGGEGNDLIFDGTGNDSFVGGGGDDSIIGGAGNDVFDGGDGNDTISTADGNDTTFFDGDDTIFGGEGNDLIFDGAGNDSFVGGGGDDSIIGGSGNDVFDGGMGNDTITSAGGNDTTFFDGDDTIFGGEGNDLIFDGAGNDSIAGGAGDDSIAGGEGNDVFDGGMGNDTITSAGGIDTTFFDGDDTIFGGEGNDLIFDGEGNDSFVGGGGDDSIIGGAGNDIFDGGMGNDTITSATGNDTTFFDGDDTIFGGDGNDLIFDGEGNDSIAGGVGDDTIVGGAGNDVLDGGQGNDSVTGAVGDDTLDGGLGNDTLTAGDGMETLFGGEGNDLIFGGPNSSLIDAGDGNDAVISQSVAGAQTQILGNAGDDTILSGAGDETVSGGAGDNDWLIEFADTDMTLTDGTLVANGMTSFSEIERVQLAGGDGDNLLDASAFSGDAVLLGGLGNDTLLGGSGNDILNGGPGDDFLNGGPGDDTYVFDPESDGNDTIGEAPTSAEGVATLAATAAPGSDMLDFGQFPQAITLDLAASGLQPVAANLSLTILDTNSLEDVTGTAFSDHIFGNGLDNKLYGGGGVDELVGGAGNDLVQADVTKRVFLDFDSQTDKEAGEHVYTGDERLAIEQRLAADFADFDFEFTQTRPAEGPFVTVLFNATPLFGAGGRASQLGWRIVELSGTVIIDVNGFLGAGNGLAPTPQTYVALSSTITAHELGHQFGLKHHDSFGDLGAGIYSKLNPSRFLPDYPGLTAADQTRFHLLASPGSVGTSLVDAAGDPFFGERERIKLAFAETGTSLSEIDPPDGSPQVTIDGVPHSAQDLGELAMVSVPIQGQDRSVAALNVEGSIELAADGFSESDFYAIQGTAGDLLTVEVLSDSLDRIDESIDSVLRIYDSTGHKLDYYGSVLGAFNDDDLELTDSMLLDVRLPETGTYFVEVDTFQFRSPEFATYVPDFDVEAFAREFPLHPGVADNDVGDYELFLYRTSPELAAQPATGDTLSGGLGEDTLIGSSGRDEIFGFNFDQDTLIDRGGAPTFRSGRLSITLDRSTINEGESLALSGRFDGDAQEILIDYGDGIVEPLSDSQIDRTAGTFSASHVYGDDQPGAAPDQFTLMVTLNGLNDSVTAEATIGVRNLAPQNVDAGKNRIQVFEGQPVAFTAGFVDVPADAITITWSVDNPDGQLLIEGNGPDFAFTPLDDGVYRVQLTVSDDDGGQATDLVEVFVENGPPRNVSGGEDQTVLENQLVSLTAEFEDSPADTHTFLWQVFADNGQVIADGHDRDFEFTPVDDGVYAVILTVMDDDGGHASDLIQVISENAPPQNVRVVGDLTAVENELVSLTAAFDDTPADTHTFLWQVSADNGQVAADGHEAAFEFTPDNNGLYTVTLTVTDDDGGSGSATVVVTVENVPPVVTIAGPDSAVRWQERSFTFSTVDPDDSIFDYQIDWNGDGTLIQTVTAAGPVLQLTHVYESTGLFSVRAIATDEDGGVSEIAVHEIDVRYVDVQVDPWNENALAVLVGGTDFNDAIDFLALGETGVSATIRTSTPGGQATATADVAPTATGYQMTTDLPDGTATVVDIASTAAIDRLIAFGRAGNDVIRVSSQLAIDSLLFGDDGRDILIGGAGDNVILGGEGDDALFGGDGRDVLIGGGGADRLLALGEEDLLIGGVLNFADRDRALRDIARHWSDRTVDYAARVAALSTGTNGLIPGVTVFNDGDRDILNGGADLDWFLGDEDEDVFHATLDEIFSGIDESLLNI